MLSLSGPGRVDLRLRYKPRAWGSASCWSSVLMCQAASILPGYKAQQGLASGVSDTELLQRFETEGYIYTATEASLPDGPAIHCPITSAI